MIVAGADLRLGCGGAVLPCCNSASACAFTIKQADWVGDMPATGEFGKWFPVRLSDGPIAGACLSAFPSLSAMQPAFVRGGFLFLARITLHTHATSCIDLKQSFHPMLWCSASGRTQCLLQLALSALRGLLAWVGLCTTFGGFADFLRIFFLYNCPHENHTSTRDRDRGYPAQVGAGHWSFGEVRERLDGAKAYTAQARGAAYKAVREAQGANMEASMF